MKLKEIENKEEWELFFENCFEKTFLQSWNWGDFNLSLGNKIWRMGIYNNDTLISIALIVKISARRANFLLIPHGPIFISGLSLKDKKNILELLVSEFNRIKSLEKIDFVRVSPLLHEEQGNQEIFLDLGFMLAPIQSSTYEATWKLDISKSEEDLLSNMRKTTRYLIKKTSTDPNISIIKSKDINDILVYQKLNKEIAERQGFTPFSDDFVKNEFNAFAKDDKCVLLFGKYNEKIVCGALIIFWSGIAFYHQAASLGEYAKFSIPYLLQWEAIKEAKKRKCTIYDFWGFTDPQKFPKHPWAGPTLFKMGFGGYKTEYLKTHDMPLTNRYWLNYIIEKIRKFKRGL